MHPDYEMSEEEWQERNSRLRQAWGPTRVEKKIADIERQIATLKRQIDNGIGMFETFDRTAESKRDGTVIRVVATFKTGPKVYTWAALRAGGGWFLTGADSPRHGLTYAGLVSFFVDDKEVVAIDILRSANTILSGDNLG